MSKLTKKMKTLKAGDVVQQTGDKMTDEQIRLGKDAESQKEATGQNPASWVADEETWEKAKEAASKSYSESDDAYWPAVTHIYENMGGTIKSSNASVKAEILQCRASGIDINANQPWEMGKEATFCYMPSGLHTITAGFRGKAITITVNVTPDTAQTVQASFQNLMSEAPKQRPFGDIEHKEEEASFHPVRFLWGNHLGEEGVLCAAEPTALGVRNVNGKIHRSFSPSFATDADYSKAKFDGSVYTFPEGVRGSASNPARITGIDFCVGTLTNKPAFRAMPPVKAKQADTVTAGGPGSGRKAGVSGLAKKHGLLDRGGNHEANIYHFAHDNTNEAAEKVASDLREQGHEAVVTHTKYGSQINEHLLTGIGEKGKAESPIIHIWKTDKAFAKASEKKCSKDTVKANQVSDAPTPAAGEGQKDYTDLDKCADYKSRVAEVAEDIYGDGEKHGKKFKLHNEAAMAHKAAAETCPTAEGRQEHEAKAAEHQKMAQEHGKIVASRKSLKLSLQAKQAEYAMAKITAESSEKYDDAAKAADVASKVASAHEEVYPDGEKHGTKHSMHSIAAEAHNYAAKLAGDTHDIERHSKAADEHMIEAEKHAKVKASKKGGSADVVRAGGPGSGRHKGAQSAEQAKMHAETSKHLSTSYIGEKYKPAQDASAEAHAASQKAFESGTAEDHAKAAELHSKAAEMHHANGAPGAASANEHFAEVHKGFSGKVKSTSASVFADLVKAQSDQPLTSAAVLATLKPVNASSILESLKASKPAEKKPENKPAKSADSKTILASLAHAKLN
jgi:hypothetical protein